jgi:translation initiation factor IF-2
VGFRVKTAHTALVLAERDKIQIKTFNIIYELIQEVRQAMEKSIGAEKIKVDVGKLKALAIFLTDKNRQIVGGKVIEGEIKKGTQIEVFRNQDYIGKGRIISLQKNKKTADKAAKGEECGVLYEGENKVQEGDVLNFFVEESRKANL